jgi:ubiquinone biosynthesis protein
MKIYRLLRIYWVLLRHGLDKIIWVMPFFQPLRIFKLFFPWRWFQPNKVPSGTSIRLALIELGPIFVKFGQLLSTRNDILPPDITVELAKLQDKVPPFSGQQAIQIIEQSLQKPLLEVFAEFESVPLASASIAQVHAATLLDGKQVVVKVVRPTIFQKIRNDIALLEFLASMVHQYLPVARRYRLIEVVAEFKSTLFYELDLMREGANASQLKRNFAHSKLLYVPEIYWDLSCTNVLIMERIYGVPIADIATLRNQQVNLKKLAERGVEIFFTQVLRDCFFHADMHPGNIFVATQDPENPQYIAVDFGIMGTLSPEDQNYLAQNFLAFFKRDYHQVAELHIESGWIPASVRVDEFESAIRTVCEPIFERPLKDLSFGKTLLRLFQTARAFDMQVQPQLLLLQKTLLSIEGLGRQLYPDLDLWHTAKPFLEQWMKDNKGPIALFNKIKTRLPQWVEHWPDLPEDLYALLHAHKKQALLNMAPLSPKPVAELPQHLLRNRLLGTLLLGGGGALLFHLVDPLHFWQDYAIWISVTLVLTGIGLLLKKS